MKKIINDSRLMIKVADLHYNQHLNYQEIAAFLKISRPTVSLLLSKALKENIVQISVRYLETVRYWELEQQLKEKWGLRDAVIVEASRDPEELKRSLGDVAGAYLESNLQERDQVGISMGSTLYHLAHRSVEHLRSGLMFVPLIGGMGQLRAELHSNHLAENLAQNYGGSFVPLYAPARVSSPAVRKELMKEESVAEVLALQKNLSVAVVGIGYPNEKSSIKATGYYKNNEIRSLLDRKAAGEICMQFYNLNGENTPYKKDNNVVGIDLNKLRKIPLSIGVAGGLDKLPAMIGAINGKYINVLITDHQCAEAMLDFNREVPYDL